MAAFLDRDGTLIRNDPYGHDPDKIELLGGVASGLRALHNAGYRLIVATNQSGIARGYFGELVLARMHEHLSEILAAEGVCIDAFYYCPHHVQGTVAEYAIACSCRKPQPGMLLQAARDFQIDLRRSWLIGDTLDDVEAGNRAGCRTVLLSRGRLGVSAPQERTPHGVASDFLTGVGLILSPKTSSWA